MADLTGLNERNLWRQLADERAAHTQALRIRDEQADALRKQLLCPATGKTWEWHYKALVADFVDDSSEESLDENAVAKLQVEAKDLHRQLEEARAENARLREWLQLAMNRLPVGDGLLELFKAKIGLTQSGGA